MPRKIEVEIDPRSPFRINVDTNVFPGGLIEQTLDMMGAVTRKVINTQEAQIREALIMLGWTPPPDGWTPPVATDTPGPAVSVSPDTSPASGVPALMCVHCGRFKSEAERKGSTRCNAPFSIQPHQFTREHPYIREQAEKTAECDHAWEFTGTDYHGSHKGEDHYRPFWARRCCSHGFCLPAKGCRRSGPK